MRGYKYGLLLFVMSCWGPVAIADPAAGAGAASAVKATPSPEEDYQAAKKALRDDDLMEAGNLLRRAADRGHAQAQAEIAAMLEYATAWKEALEYYQKSAEQGNAAGQFGLGLTYALGLNKEVKQDLVEARKWITLAAEQENREAIIALSNAYVNGGLGLDEKMRSGPDAVIWIKRAADINHAPAVNELAIAYRTGKYGLAVDLAQAAAWEDKYSKLTGKKAEKKTSKMRR